MKNLLYLYFLAACVGTVVIAFWAIGTFVTWFEPVLGSVGTVQMEKSVYETGEKMRGKLTYCKYREVEGTILWDGHKTLKSPLLFGCHSRLIQVYSNHAVIEYQQNPFHTALYELKTTDFTIK